MAAAFSSGSASASPSVVCVGAPVTFSAGASAVPDALRVTTVSPDCATNITGGSDTIVGYSYTWRLSTGASGSGSTVTTNFSTPGTYTCTFTVTASNLFCQSFSANYTASATVIGVSVEEVDFTNAHPMHQNSTDHGGWGVGDAITTNWTASGVANPACYTRSNAVSMNVTLANAPAVPPGASLGETLILAGPGGLGGSASVSLTGSTETVSITTTGSLTNVVYEVTPTFNWSLVCGNATNSIGSSTHTIYVTYADPIADGGSLTPRRLDEVAVPASGLSNVLAIASAIYSNIYSSMQDGDLVFCDKTSAVAKNFAFVGSICAPGATPLPGGITDNWFMYSPVVSGVWDIRGACIAFAELNNLELQILGIGNGTPVDLAPVPDATACSLIVQYNLGYPSYVTNYFVCNGTSYQAFLRYCGGNAPNNFEGALQVIVGTTTNYYAGASDYTSPDPGQILKDVSSFEFWQWTTNYDAGFLLPASCCANYCTIVQGCPNAATMSAPNCP